MGYTHYWNRPKSNAGSAYMFGKLALDAKKLCEYANANGIRIRNGNGEGEPEFNEALLSINGDSFGTRIDGNSLAPSDLAHESFIWEGIPSISEWQKLEPEIFDFCKTARKPYDAVVTAILIRAKHIYGDCVSVSSDGDWHEWEAGCKLYEQVFGEVAACPFDKVKT